MTSFVVSLICLLILVGFAFSYSYRPLIKIALGIVSVILLFVVAHSTYGLPKYTISLPSKYEMAGFYVQDDLIYMMIIEEGNTEPRLISIDRTDRAEEQLEQTREQQGSRETAIVENNVNNSSGLGHIILERNIHK